MLAAKALPTAQRLNSKDTNKVVVFLIELLFTLALRYFNLNADFNFFFLLAIRIAWKISVGNATN